MLTNEWLKSKRQVLMVVVVACLGLLGFGLYLQHSVGLEPCPMCIVQRYCLVMVGLLCLVGAAPKGPASGRGSTRWSRGFTVLAVVFSLGGAFVAARQSFLQWYPPEIVTCGRDLYGMIETFPLQRVIPMIFKGSGDCTAIDWTFLGLSIANWSFICFVLIAVTLVLLPKHRKGA
jgi:protein dithiol:quinone oxidoreductase